MKTIKIFVAAHKVAPKYGDDCYQMIHVGAEKSSLTIPNAIKDDCCYDNISKKNDIYCELTGLYHMWKNVKGIDYIGLCHYRRLPVSKNLLGKATVLSTSQLINIMENNDVILPDVTKKNGEINGYFKVGDQSILSYRPYQLMLPVVKELYPDYLEDFELEFHTEYMSFGNIMVCSKPLFDEYCKWLFDILFKVEKNIKESGDKVLPRELGFYSEWLLNIWIRHNKLRVKNVPLFLPEQKTLQRRIIDKIKKM
ncbi:MAG: DUF4422 domain-containing protein [Prevotellaceae bacterium]|nr:DUF4422 domain-containing protein [Prevotellaceae bacterium]